MSLPGGVALSSLRVYDWPAADRLCGGTPHMHLACTEAYAVTDGIGQVQTLTWDGFIETPLAAGTVVHFTPGTIHRLINGDGELRLLVLMANSGLPEAGDAVFTFPPGIMADPGAYRDAARISTAEDARRRRDLALEGFTLLRQGGTEALEAFHAAARDRIAAQLDHFETIWRSGALAAAMTTGEQLASIRAGDLSHLKQAAVVTHSTENALGMCGHLQRVR